MVTLLCQRIASLDRCAGLLQALSHRGVLARGFALVRDAKRRPIPHAARVSSGMSLDIEFFDGHVRASAEHAEERERSNHELEQFAYVASHDLQEPLRAISGCVEILELRYAPQLDARGHELIEHAVAGVGRMRELIEDLLEYSRVRLGGALESVSAETALSAALRQLESAVEKTGAVVEHGELPTVHADPKNS